MTGGSALDLAGRRLSRAVGARLRRGFPLAPLTTFRLGGPAGLFLEAESDADLSAAGEAVRESGASFLVVGRGSNLLVADEGFPGLVVRLGRGYRFAARDGDRISAGGAMPLPALAGVAHSHRLSGLEFGVAIPATTGGGVAMNAGAHGHEVSEVLESFDVFDLVAGARERVSGKSGGFGYRRSGVGELRVVVSARFALTQGEPAAIRQLMDEARRWRRLTQPLSQPNCGSVFKNPPGGHAAKLVESAGAKGLRVGGAQVSPKHANFIVAHPGATARDVRALIDLVRERVARLSGVTLESEVHLVGDFVEAG